MTRVSIPVTALGGSVPMQHCVDAFVTLSRIPEAFPPILSLRLACVPTAAYRTERHCFSLSSPSQRRAKLPPAQRIPTTKTRTLAYETTATSTSTPTPTTSYQSSSSFAPEFTTAEASARAISSSAVPWCLREHVSYERLSGYKVADMLAGQRTLSLPEPTQPEPPSTAEECYMRCLDDDRCRGYSVNHVRQVCTLTWFDVANKSDYLLADPNWSFHRKICLPGEYGGRHVL
ncbi:hypothetical protein HPB50_020969 [Hyalomma asiaticum]|uniref:Uncharacterized protein n=1 Tax=Hyalomma asiaticum TaxID=266040 RepID=A0ACB7T3V6_HYAAI|nr:hypothetical protein HPB50_020969 [Hyalomma asiaticum]